ncbi:uncharacterized protein LOC143211527 isoform X1 [Lasioglossum baleicum]|uniref:uncharacterized protein LOC143211527 isoform X1 n=1 Tax=Lasioglossum baleicum TaxID=434251 RepID=UPI003FCE3562
MRSHHLRHSVETSGGRSTILLEESGRTQTRFYQRVLLPREAEVAELGGTSLPEAELFLGRDDRAAEEDQRVCLLHPVQEDPLLLQSQGRRGEGREEDQVLRQSQIAAQSGRSLHGQASQQIPDNLQVRSTIQSRETQEDSDLLRVQVVPVQMQEIEIEEAEDEVLLLQELSLRVSST